MESILTILAIVIFGGLIVIFFIYGLAVMKLGIIDPLVNIFKTVLGLKKS